MQPAPSPSSSSKMIQWSLKRARADPETLARDLIAATAEGTLDGTVVVERGARGKTERTTKKRKKGAGAPVAPSGGPDKLRFSVILRVWEGSSIQLMRLIAPFSASEAIRRDTGIITWIRWPDRVVIGEKTVATATLAVVPGGPDTAAKPPQDPTTHIILTFGINIRTLHTDGETRDGEATEDLTTISLHDALGVEVDENLLLEKLLESLAWMHLGWRRGMNDQIVRRVKTMVETIGMRVVVVDHMGRERPGYAKDIDGIGRLVVELDEGGGGSSVAVEGGGDDDDGPAVRLREI